MGSDACKQNLNQPSKRLNLKLPEELGPQRKRASQKRGKSAENAPKLSGLQSTDQLPDRHLLRRLRRNFGSRSGHGRGSL